MRVRSAESLFITRVTVGIVMMVQILLLQEVKVAVHEVTVVEEDKYGAVNAEDTNNAASTEIISEFFPSILARTKAK